MWRLSQPTWMLQQPTQILYSLRRCHISPESAHEAQLAPAIAPIVPEADYVEAATAQIVAVAILTEASTALIVAA